jgi:hypothetical protein
MSKQSRHQSVISRQSDSDYSEDHWLKQFEQKLQKGAVQPYKGDSLYDQINSIMNGKSKYPSVQAAVDDMMSRSGLTAYLDNVKVSQEETFDQNTKTAQHQPQPQAPGNQPDVPSIIKQKPNIMRTLENIIKETRGNIPVPAIISRLHALHANDISDEGAWEEDALIRLVSQMNLKAKSDNPDSYENFDNLGQGDHSTADSDIDASNTDAFNALMPAKI